MRDIEIISAYIDKRNQEVILEVEGVLTDYFGRTYRAG